MINKEELITKQLYFIKSKLTETPYFVNSEFFVLFTEKSVADSVAQRICQRLSSYFTVGDAPVSVCVITDNTLFFQEMMAIGYSKFSFNGEGQISDLNILFEKNNDVSPEEKELYIYYMGYMKMQKSSHIGSVKRQKIESASQLLNSNNNQKMIQRFIESQNKLKQYYKEC